MGLDSVMPWIARLFVAGLLSAAIKAFFWSDVPRAQAPDEPWDDEEI